MNISLTQKEYQSLIDLLAIANRVLTSYQTEKSAEITAYSELRHKIYSYAQEAKLENLITHDQQKNKDSEMAECKNNSAVTKYLDEFSEEIFWEQLIVRLAERDVLAHFNADDIQQLDLKKRIEETAQFEHYWADEFESHGLSRLKVDASE